MTIKQSSYFHYMENSKIIVLTHDESFHADDAAGSKMIEIVFGKENIMLQRSRKLEDIKKANITIDVGKEYNPDQNKFDHHMFDELYYYDNDNKWVMSSVGMVYKKFGDIFLQKMIGFSVCEEHLYQIKDAFYQEIVKELDLIDNGIKTTDNPRYIVKTNLTSIVGMFNGLDVYDDNLQLQQFEKAMKYIENVFRIKINSLCNKYIHKTITRKNNIITKHSNKIIFLNTNYFDSINSNVMASAMIINTINENSVSIIFASNPILKKKIIFYDFRDRYTHIEPIFNMFGEKLIVKILEKNGINNISDEHLYFVFMHMKKSLVKEIVMTTKRIKQNEHMSYEIRTDLSSLIHNSIFFDCSLSEIMDLAYQVFERNILDIYDSVINHDDDEKMIIDAIETRHDICDTGKIIYLKKYIKNPTPLIVRLEKIMNIKTQIFFIIMYDNKKWKITTFKNRGKLVKSEHPDIIFIHHNFFCGATNSLEAAINLCKLSCNND